MNFGLFYRQMLPNSHSKITLSLGGEGGGKQKDILSYPGGGGGKKYQKKDNNI